MHHFFEAVWKQRGFKKTDGTPTQHLGQILELMSAMMLPTKLAIIMCQANKKGNNFVIQRNNAEDKAIKQMSICHPPALALQVSVVTYHLSG